MMKFFSTLFFCLLFWPNLSWSSDSTDEQAAASAALGRPTKSLDAAFSEYKKQGGTARGGGFADYLRSSYSVRKDAGGIMLAIGAATLFGSMLALTIVAVQDAQDTPSDPEEDDNFSQMGEAIERGVIVMWAILAGTLLGAPLTIMGAVLYYKFNKAIERLDGLSQVEALSAKCKIGIVDFQPIPGKKRTLLGLRLSLEF